MLFLVFGLVNIVTQFGYMKEHRKSATITVFYIASMTSLILGAGISFVMTLHGTSVLWQTMDALYLFSVFAMYAAHCGTVVELKGCLKIVQSAHNTRRVGSVLDTLGSEEELASNSNKTEGNEMRDVIEKVKKTRRVVK